jgi:3-oxoadipate enol-lactonase
VSAVEVHHVEEGPVDAPVLVLSNSLGSTLSVWDPQMPALARRFRVVRYDLRGHGASPVPPAPYEIDDLGADLLALLDRLGLERVHLGGLSLGGLVSAWVAEHEPARVGRLVLCCTAANFGNPQSWLDRAATVRLEGTGAVADTVVGRWFTPGFAARQPALVIRMRDMIAATPAVGYAACCEVLAKTDLRQHLPSIAAPSLVIAGAEDPAVSRAQAEELAGGIPGSRLEVVEDAAHLASVERPDEVTRLMLAQLTEEEP